MSLSIRRQLRDAVVSRLQAAAIPGVKTISAWRQAAYNPEELPALLVTDGDAAMEAVNNAEAQHILALDVVVMTSGSGRMDDVTETAAAVLAALGADPYQGGLSSWSEPTGVFLISEQVGNAVAWLKITVSITYHTPLWSM